VEAVDYGSHEMKSFHEAPTGRDVNRWKAAGAEKAS